MKVKLKYPHTHAGQNYPAGAEIDVDVPEAIWLKAQDLVHTEWDALKAAAGKLASKDNPAPYASELAAAQAKTQAVDTPSVTVPPQAPIAANPASTQEATK